MSRLPMKKNLMTCLSCLVVSACAAPSYACHEWTVTEEWRAQRDDRDIPADSPLHGMIKDYERLCVK